MRRNENWPEKLHAFIEARRAMPFKWGKNDCCLFACDAVIEMTGIDLAAEYRGKYNSALGAYRLINHHGGVVGAFKRACAPAGIEEVDVKFAQTGDVVAIDSGKHGMALGICLSHLSVFASSQGAVFLPPSRWLNVWRI